MCARTAGGIHQTAGKEKGILLQRGERVKGSPGGGQPSAPHTAVSSPCSTNNCKREEPAEGSIPRRVFPPGAVAGLGWEPLTVTPRGSASQDGNNPSPPGPGKAAAAGRDGGVQGEGKEESQPRGTIAPRKGKQHCLRDFTEKHINLSPSPQKNERKNIPIIFGKAQLHLDITPHSEPEGKRSCFV